MSCVYCHSLWISFIYDIAKRCEVIRALVLAVHAVIDGNEADTHLGEPDFTNMDKTTKTMERSC